MHLQIKLELYVNRFFHLSKRLKDPSQHFLSDIEVQRADVQPHRA